MPTKEVFLFDTGFSILNPSTLLQKMELIMKVVVETFLVYVAFCCLQMFVS